jgi:hypothetical protein
MNARQNRILGSILLVGTLLFAAVVVSHAQTQNRSGEAAAGRSPSASPSNTDAEREKIWNSPSMLRARAWLQDYFSKSAKVTPQEAQTYMKELENLTPVQMKLWLIKFDHEEEQRQQQYAFWQQTHAAALSQARAVNQATQRAYADINREETEAANLAQQQINEQRQASQEMAEAKQLETVGPYGGGAYGLYGYPGGLHYHYHLYPYRY